MLALADLVSRKYVDIEYEYDFGDSWRHRIKLTPVGVREQATLLESAVGLCPPEDCGSSSGFNEILAAYAHLADPRMTHGLTDDDTLAFDLSARRQQTVEWIGKDYNPYATADYGRLRDAITLFATLDHDHQAFYEVSKW